MAKRPSERNSGRKHESIITHLRPPRDFALERMLWLPLSYGLPRICKYRRRGDDELAGREHIRHKQSGATQEVV